MKPTYRKNTSFDVFIKLGDNIYNVMGTYYYAPDEVYGESPNEFTQDDSELDIREFYKCYEVCEEFGDKTYYVCLKELLEFDEVYSEVSRLVWDKILNSDWE